MEPGAAYRRQGGVGDVAQSGGRGQLGVLAVIVVGVLMIAADTTIVILAMPTMSHDLHVGMALISWVSIIYILVMTLLTTQVGRLGDMYGRTRIYQTGIFIFTAGSLLCGLAQDALAIIAFRVLQAVGGAIMTANAGAIIADTFPPAVRGRAYGWQNMGWNAGAVVGILLGGILTTFFGWRYIFWINVPIGAGMLYFSGRLLVERSPRVSRRLDGWGMALLGLGLFGLLTTMNEMATAQFSPRIWVQLGASVAILALFGWVEGRQRDPMLRLGLFRLPLLRASLLAFFFQSLGNFAVLFLMMLYLQGVRQLSPLTASLLLVPGYMVSGVAGPVSGRLCDRMGPVIPATAGLGLQVAGVLVFAALGRHTGFWLVLTGALLNGVGAGGFFPSNSASLMKSAPAEAYGVAYGMLRTFGNMGQVFSFAMALLVAGAFLPRGLTFAVYAGQGSVQGGQLARLAEGIHAALYAAVAAFLVAAGFSLSRGSGSLTRRRLFESSQQGVGLP